MFPGAPRFSVRALACALGAVLVATVVSVGVGPAVPADAAGRPGYYSAPEWLPLQYTPGGAPIAVGCGYKSPAPACWLRDTNHHPYWAIDFLAPKGTVVYAAGAGQVRQLRKGEPGCSTVANFVDIDHDPNDFSPYGVWSDYWHLDEVWVELGEWVDVGQPIGTVGDTGMGGMYTPDSKGECGPHLHYEKLLDLWPNRIDPGPLLACHGATMVSYPQLWGLNTWEGIPWGQYRLYSDGTACRGTQGPSGFFDVQADHPFGPEIAWLVDEGITTGYPDATFRPLTPVFRQSLAAFLFRLDVPQEPIPLCSSPPFSDVAMNHPFCGAIAWMEDNDLADGYDDGTFRPSEAISRQAVVAFLHRLAGAPQVVCVGSPFIDIPADHPFCKEILWATQLGITTGYDDGTFRPGAEVTRQAVAAFLHRYAS